MYHKSLILVFVLKIFHENLIILVQMTSYHVNVYTFNFLLTISCPEIFKGEIFTVVVIPSSPSIQNLE